MAVSPCSSQSFGRNLAYGVNRMGQPLGPVSKAYRAVEKHSCKRLRRWLCAQHQEVWPGTKSFPEASLHDVLGLLCIIKRTRNLPWASSGAFLREPETGNPHIRFDQRDVEMEAW
jgi:hypothetical protein